MIIRVCLGYIVHFIFSGISHAYGIFGLKGLFSIKLYAFRSIPQICAVNFSYVSNFFVLEIKKPRVSGKKKTIPQDVVENNSVFGQLLKTAGITLKAGESQNEIGIDILPCPSFVDGMSVSYAKSKYKLQMDIENVIF